MKEYTMKYWKVAMFVERHARPSRIKSTTVINDLPSRPEENGETIEASASERAKPACAARKPPQSLPPSPHMPVTRARLWKYFTTLILSSGFMRANMTSRYQISSSSLGFRCKYLHAPWVTASLHSSNSGPFKSWVCGESESGSRHSIAPEGPKSPSSTRAFSGKMLHCLPMEMPVKALSPVQITERIAPLLNSLIAFRESFLISFLNSSSPHTDKPASRPSRVKSAICCCERPGGRVFVAMPRT
mmetsp:Transcript_43090/g.125387  ORF Transcript_43090/g.125387 Transcript_43090/m.125387 type:complete len:245 (+) Transcript_43090:1235-1969(+)